MPRPRKCRRVCSLPRICEFSPVSDSFTRNPVVLTVDEYETIRLIDKEGASQEECSAYMGVARTTVQQIYSSARQKIAFALVDGRPLKIEGGDYRLCDGTGKNSRCSGCHRHRQYRENFYQEVKDMKIAVTYENGEVFQHFGHTEQFKIYTVEDQKIADSTIVDTNGSGHGALAGFLAEHGVDTLICGGIGGGARTALSEVGIQLYPGVSGSADQAVEALLQGTLTFDPDTTCNHHGEHHHGDHEHSCGNHGCGEHTCGH